MKNMIHKALLGGLAWGLVGSSLLAQQPVGEMTVVRVVNGDTTTEVRSLTEAEIQEMLQNDGLQPGNMMIFEKEIEMDGVEGEVMEEVEIHIFSDSDQARIHPDGQPGRVMVTRDVEDGEVRVEVIHLDGKPGEEAEVTVKVMGAEGQEGVRVMILEDEDEVVLDGEKMEWIDENGNRHDLKKGQQVIVIHRGIRLEDLNEEERSRLGDEQGQELAVGKVEVFPSPTDGLSSIRFEVPNATEEVTLKVMDLQGRTLIEDAFAGQTTYETSIDMSGAAAGTYLVQIVQGDKRWTRKLIRN